ncbi:hypothetical protein LNKW23_37880 [Paralimibaculum aggregatum]|uniref:Transposase IS116/IS110/IS902 C-terminal domain-containing protein n=1 Tax=Paralimibaculum aggregatum TaxID=3036245 RepID=A0ABQ6LMZ5_9RHOB|nr:transposase [Limibaculum sp. NKW23]GMG84572.1 hypothetical protein LNKW23_37880 [Limibaculum sp. NKW23]
MLAAHVKPFVKRQKKDRADAEAIAEDASRPAMRFVAVRSAETQGRAAAFRTRQCLVRQRTQLISAPRSHLAEFGAELGLVVPKGPANLEVLENARADEAGDLSAAVRETGRIHLDRVARLAEVVERLAGNPETASRTDEAPRRLCTMPGIGPVTAGAVAAFAPDLDRSGSGRNLAARPGLVLRQRSAERSTGGKAQPGAVSRMGRTDIGRRPIVGALSVT